MSDAEAPDVPPEVPLENPRPGSTETPAYAAPAGLTDALSETEGDGMADDLDATETELEREELEAITEPTKGRGGAPVGNVNAARDPDFTRRMRHARALAKKAQAARRRKHEGEAAAVLDALGYAKDPMRPYLQRDLADVAREREELVLIVNRVSRTDRLGNLSEPYTKLLSVIERAYTLHTALIVALTTREAGQPKTLRPLEVKFVGVDGVEVRPRVSGDPEVIPAGAVIENHGTRVLDITPSVSTFPEPRPEDGALVPTVAPAATVAVEQPRAFDRELKGFGRRLGRGGERQSIADMDF